MAISTGTIALNAEAGSHSSSNAPAVPPISVAGANQRTRRH